MLPAQLDRAAAVCPPRTCHTLPARHPPHTGEKKWPNRWNEAYLNQHQDDNIAETVIKRLPDKAEALIALEKHRQEKAEQLDTQFRLNWEPLIRWTIERFDTLTRELQSQGAKLNVQERNDKFPLTTFGGAPGSPEIRSIDAPGVGSSFGIKMYYQAISLAPEEREAAASLTINVVETGEMLSVTISLDEAKCIQTAAETKENKQAKISVPRFCRGRHR